MKRRREDRNGYDRILSEIAERTNRMKTKITMMKLKVPLMMLWIHLRGAA
jgi:hypothetical protein